MSSLDFRPLDAQVVPRFAGIRTFMRLPHRTDLESVDAATVGIPFDTGTSYRSGARFGPEAVRSASALLRPYHPTFGLDLLDAVRMIDYGDIPVAPGATEATYARIEAGLEPLVSAGVTPLVIGGDHTITLAELRALARRYGSLSLLQLDAHLDTWDSYFGQRYFHGTTFRRAVEEGVLDPETSVQAGARGSLYASDDLAVSREMGFRVIPSEELRALGPAGFAEVVGERLDGKPVFLSFDIDFVDPAYAPGTGTPEIGGFTTAEALAFLRALREIHLVGADVVEISPAYDGNGQITALAGANILWELLALRAVRSPSESVASAIG